MKQVKRLTNKQKKEISKHTSDLKGWGYVGVHEDDIGNKKDVYRKIINGKVDDEILILLEGKR